MSRDFKVGDKVRYVPHPGDETAYLVPNNEARVAALESPEETNYYIGIRFSYNPEIYPTKPSELELIEEEK